MTSIVISSILGNSNQYVEFESVMMNQKELWSWVKDDA
eukprot:CAMPEP_0201988994 /NCGR_PEP_ID=MMETSP0904-20121228/92621_1 /ASSEMBLY_ACC=CAM_ASM_000553 /TAXON_ID=420261 /ORGANISM="Thalassiosira antarctica, Strain CCMP982" /LENGTH=37 /DNA_ID= /DNA_START= /DNA_END= /DNA_ORIENTATION=